MVQVLVLMYTGANSFVGGARMKLPGLETSWKTNMCNYGWDASNCPEKANNACWVCPEDELGWVLFKTLILDFVVSKMVALLLGGIQAVKARLKKDPGQAKTDFQTSEMVIQLLYVQVIHAHNQPCITNRALLYENLQCNLIMLLYVSMSASRRCRGWQFRTSPPCASGSRW